MCNCKNRISQPVKNGKKTKAITNKPKNNSNNNEKIYNFYVM